MNTQVSAPISIEPVKQHIGGIVHVDKAHLLDGAVIAALHEALEDRTVLVFPGIHLTDEEQLAFTDAFGSRVNFTRRVPGSDATSQDVYKITLDPEINSQPEYVLGTFFWHIDGATIDQPLPKATLLSARKLSKKGGQTEFCNTYAAYEHLSDEEKADIAGLKVLHTLESSVRQVHGEIGEEDIARWKAMDAHMVHPLVWTHKSGRKSLVLGSHADRVMDMGLPEGRSLLARMTEWAGQPDFSYRHHWQDGDFVIWDNCGAMHRVVPYDRDSGRTMHRTSIAGDERVG